MYEESLLPIWQGSGEAGSQFKKNHSLNSISKVNEGKTQGVYDKQTKFTVWAEVRKPSEEKCYQDC